MELKKLFGSFSKIKCFKNTSLFQVYVFSITKLLLCIHFFIFTFFCVRFSLSFVLFPRSLSVSISSSPDSSFNSLFSTARRVFFVLQPFKWVFWCFCYCHGCGSNEPLTHPGGRGLNRLPTADCWEGGTHSRRNEKRGTATQSVCQMFIQLRVIAAFPVRSARFSLETSPPARTDDFHIVSLRLHSRAISILYIEKS